MRTRRIRGAALAVLLLSGLVACGGPVQNEAQGPTDGSVQPTDGSEPSVEPRVGQSMPEDSNAPPIRVANFQQTYTYEDGLVIKISKIEHGKVTKSEAQYSDVIKAGQPWTQFTIKVTNNSKESLELYGEAQASYGPDGTSAMPIEAYHFEKEFDDTLDGTLVPGRSLSATYAFSIPAREFGDVQLEFVPTYDHEPALFIGKT